MHVLTTSDGFLPNHALLFSAGALQEQKHGVKKEGDEYDGNTVPETWGCFDPIPQEMRAQAL